MHCCIKLNIYQARAEEFYQWGRVTTKILDNLIFIVHLKNGVVVNVEFRYFFFVLLSDRDVNPVLVISFQKLCMYVRNCLSEAINIV